MVFGLYRSRKPTAVTRCMCPLYDTNRQAWIELQPMSVARLGHGVVAAGQCWSRPGIHPLQLKWCRKHISNSCHKLLQWRFLSSGLGLNSYLVKQCKWQVQQIHKSLITLCFLPVRGFSVRDGRNRWKQHSPGQWREIWPWLQHLEPHTANVTGIFTLSVSTLRLRPKG